MTRHLNKFGDPPPRRIIILRALQLGDLLCAVPAWRALRAALPEAHITLLGLPWARSFVERFSSYLDEFIELPGFPGFPEAPARVTEIPGMLASVQRGKYDLTIQMQGSGAISNPLIMLLGAQMNAGFYIPGQYCPDGDRFLAYPEHEHEVWRHLRLMEFLGLPFEEDGEDVARLEFPLRAQDMEEYHALRSACQITPGRFAVLHPGARAQERRWSPENFAALADGLGAMGLQIVLTGTAGEAPLTAAVAAGMKTRPSNRVIDLAGKTSLGGLAALLSAARMLVCNDTGVSHLAAALRLPSVVLFTASDPEGWAPLDRQRHRVVSIAAAGSSTAAQQLVLDEASDLLAKEIHSPALEGLYAAQ